MGVPQSPEAACRDLNPLYNSTLEASLLFGSGARAGVDRREQKKQAATHKAALLRKMRESQVRSGCRLAASPRS